MAGQDDSAVEFSGDYWTMPDGRDYAVFTEAASLPRWVHVWERGSLTGAILMRVLVRSRHTGPPWVVLVMSGSKVVYRKDFADIADANAHAKDLDDGLRHLRYPPREE